MTHQPKNLVTYLSERLQSLVDDKLGGLILFRAGQTSPFASGGTLTGLPGGELPLLYGPQTVGTLKWTGTASDELSLPQREKLEGAASQFAALLASPRPELAIALDRHMETLKKEQAHCDWCGIYLLREDTLYLTAFRGLPTPHPIIPSSRGICGAAVAENRTLNIEDVQQDPRYLSCDLRTRSELVVPIRDPQGYPIGEVDIDSHRAAAFSPALVKRIEELAGEIAQLLL